MGIIIVSVSLRSQDSHASKASLEFNHNLKNYNTKLWIINSANQKIAEFFVAIADSDEKKAFGLMEVEALPNKNGMLFPFFKKQVITMWMKNTYIPLDMLFIDEKQMIVSIKTNAAPHSLDIISSEKEAVQVLEINAGLVQKLKIKTGQKVKIFKE